MTSKQHRHRVKERGRESTYAAGKVEIGLANAHHKAQSAAAETSSALAAVAERAMALLSTLVSALSLLLLTAWFISSPRAPKRTKVPPGPPGIPFIGNLLSIPSKQSWLKFYEWSQVYGPLFRLNIAGREHYIVSTEQVANDLLRERGSIYSSREQLPAAAKLLSDDLRPLFWAHGETFRQGRKLFHRLCKESAAATYEPTQALEASRALYDLILHPEEYETWFERYSSGIMFRLSFGKVLQADDPWLRRIFTIVRHVERVASPGAYLVDTVPWLMYLPDCLAPFKRELKRLHAEELDCFRSLLQNVQTKMQNDTARACWEKTYLETAGDYTLTLDQGAYCIGSLFEAGAGTTAAALMSWLLCMLLYPSELRKLQHDIDAVVGPERLPGFSDIPSLPRVRAVAKETLRYRPVTAGGIPHLSTRDDVYNGVYIPAGTNIHANQWAIHRDPALYPEPESFLPDRWLSPSYPTTYREPLTRYPELSNFSAFGFGRRICPGMHIAERSLNLLIAQIAWACDISRKMGQDGREVDVPGYEYTAGFNVQPKKFEFDMRARSQERWEVVRKAYERETANDPLG